MYRYDEFDQEFVNERVAQFRGQVERRLSGELTEDQFKPLRLMNGVYLQLHAYMLRIAIPYGTLNPAQLRMLGFIARKYDRGYGHFTTRQNLQFNWPALKDIPDILDASRLGRDARHPDLGQLHPQRHRRPFRRRRRRRGRRPAALCGDPPPVVVAPPGVHLPAAQVQDRGDRRRARPRRHPGPRHRPPREARRGRQSRLRRLCRRRPRPHADDRPQDPRFPARGAISSPMSRRFCASTICSAAATTSTRRASRSSSTRPAPKRSPARSRRSGSASATRALALPTEEIRRIQAYFALPAGLVAAARRERRPRPRSRRRHRPRQLGRAEHRRRTASPATPSSPFR